MPQTAAASKTSVEGSVKETIESILVAFMLAFIFRAFVVEAFVIPTGSMAPTLLGANMRFRCPDCGYRFEVNYSGVENGSDDVFIPRSAGANKVYSIFCPNCGYRLPREDATDPANDATDPPIRYGDRILVLKYLYLLQDPNRWDVVVFKAPVSPAQFDYSQNYIKRLVGKPGETIMVLDGDVYVGNGDDLNSFHVQTKPYKVQEALWRIVYDNDYYPRNLARNVSDQYGNPREPDPSFQQPWKQTDGETGWQIGDGTPGHRDFKFSNPASSSTLFFDATANPNKYALTDWLAYDVTDYQGPGSEPDTYLNRSPSSDVNVTDVKLSFFYQRTDGAGPLRVQLSKLKHLFETQITSNDVTLLMDGNPIAGPAPLPGNHSPMHVEIANADYRVSVRINDQEILATTPQQYHPDLDKLMQDFRAHAKSEKPLIRLIGENQSCDVTHLSLWRDIYYLNRDRAGRSLTWASPEDFPHHLMHLGPDEFFVLGDNSYVSLDARYWDEPIDLAHENLHVQSGRVPRRFMLGKAFFVYWPAGFRPIESAPAIAPDFGDMRFIH